MASGAKLFQEKLVDDSLLSRLPQNPNIDSSLLLDAEALKEASFSDIIDSTASAFKEGNLSTEEALSLWELRLVLLLFDNQLLAAKSEAIDLNNLLYLHENPTASSSLKTTTAASIAERPLLLQTGSASSLNLRSEQNSWVFPLPKDNDEILSHSLLLLILRLKSVPNLSLVNELYKLCYQFRLKGSTEKAESLQRNLLSLAYEIIMVLTVTRNHATLISYLQSLRYDIRARKESGSGSFYEPFELNVKLMWIITSLHLRIKNSAALEPVLGSLKEDFDSLDSYTLQSITHVLQTYTPLVGGNSELVLQENEQLDLDKLVELAKENKISGRIICCTLAAFELQNVHGAHFAAENERPQLVLAPNCGPESKYNVAYNFVMGRWTDYLNKVYAVE